MLINKDVKASTCFNNGKDLFLKHHIKFAKYAFITVVISYFVSLYWAFFDTFLAEHPLLYVVGLILLLLIYFPIIYYSIRLTISNAEWLKNVYGNQPKKYKQIFTKSRDKFWRIFFIQLVKFLLKVIFILSLSITIMYFVGKTNMNYRMFEYQTGTFIGLIGLTFVVGVIVLYTLYRLEFADIAVFWDIDGVGKEFKTSWLLTKYNQVAKMKLVVIAHLPNFILSLASILYVLNNMDQMAIGVRWSYLSVMVVLNTFFYAWRYAMIYPALNKMKCMEEQCQLTVDEDGREWLTF